MSMGKFERLTLHLQEGAAIETSEMGKAYIDIQDDDLRLDFEDSNDDKLLKPNELEALINAHVIDDKPVTVWFLPETERSQEITVPITDATQVTIEEGGTYGAGVFDEPGVLERVQEHVNYNQGTYGSSP